MDEYQSGQGSKYRIRLKGTLDHPLPGWPGGITIRCKDGGETLLTGPFPDQAALRGFLDQLWNLNFTILSFHQVKKRRVRNPGPSKMKGDRK